MASRSGAKPDEVPTDKPPEPAAAVLRSVLRALGRPADFLRATVRAVGGDAYRVNVMTGSAPSVSSRCQ